MAVSARSIGMTITLALAASACATAPAPVAVVVPPPAPAPPAPPTLEGKWALAMLRDAPLGTKLGASIKIEADRAEGATVCQSWTASAPNFGMDLRFESLSAQELTCDGNMKAIEEKYLEALKDVRIAQMRAGYLVLLDADGRERLFFARAS